MAGTNSSQVASSSTQSCATSDGDLRALGQVLAKDAVNGDDDHFNPEEPREAAYARAKQRNLQLVCAQREAKHA